MSQVTNTKCTELFKDVVDNLYPNSITLYPYFRKLNDRFIDINAKLWKNNFIFIKISSEL